MIKQPDVEWIARNRQRREFYRRTKYEQSARRYGWVIEKEIIYNTKDYNSWQDTTTKVQGKTYVNWEQCCLCEGIEVAPPKPSIIKRIGSVLMIPYDGAVFVWTYYWKERQ
jgi:hypothetical protein